MTIEQLRYFCTVAQYKNISRAAEALFISSSAMSRHIAGLEESLGVQLLVRGGRSIELTAAGQYVFERGPAFIAAFDSFQDSIRQIHREHTSTIVIACISMYQSRLFEAFRQFSDGHPGHKLMLNPMHTWEVIGAVANGEADLGITYEFELPVGYTPLLCSRPILRDRFALLVSKDHPLSGRESVSLEEIPEGSFLASRRPNEPNADFLTRLGRQQVKPHTSHALDSPAKTVLQVKAGNGIAVFPRMLCEEYQAGCATVPIRDEDAATNLVAVWRKDAADKVLSQLIDRLESLYEDDSSAGL